jgi:hypothetical protein
MFLLRCTKNRSAMIERIFWLFKHPGDIYHPDKYKHEINLKKNYMHLATDFKLHKQKSVTSL